MMVTLLPGHDPAKGRDPAWITEWMDEYSKATDPKWIPLLDTSSDDIPPPQPA